MAKRISPVTAAYLKWQEALHKEITIFMALNRQGDAHPDYERMRQLWIDANTITSRLKAEYEAML